MFEKRSPALAPEERYRRAGVPKPVRSTTYAPAADRSGGLRVRVNSGSTLPASVPSFPRVPPPSPAVGALCASSGLSRTRALGEAAGEAVATSPSGIHGLPSSQAPGSWKDCAAVLPAPDVLGADDNDMGDGCSQKLATANILRFLLLVLIPCICALLVLLVILLSFIGTLKKTYVKSNGSEPMVTDGEVQVPDVILINTIYNESTMVPTVHPNQHIPVWTTDASLPGDQIHRNAMLCGGGESFLCTSGICVPRKLQCNGYNDCDDWSDEAHCNCSEDLFRCHTGKCLNYSFVCDGYDDCGDLSDEQNCDCNSTKEHRCGDGRCIVAEWVCDGDHDCVDKSDEVNCSCHSQGLVECRNGQCIPSSFQCDGDEDCKDGSDEENCGDSQTPCQEGDQRCLYSSCLDSCGGSSVCDPDSSLSNCSQCEPITLELCMNLPYNHTNYPNYLGHRTQKEASISWESSLFPALVQTNCYKYLMFFACTILVPKCDVNTGQRISPCRALCEHSKERCESVLGIVGLQWPEDTDCNQFPEENSDNQTCLMPDEDVEAFCQDDELECANHVCVSRDLWCDGGADCSDSSDEWDCVTLSKNVNSSFLTVHRSATEHHVCADGWQETLSQLACRQMGLGEPSATELIQEQEQDQQWLMVQSNWTSLNGTTLHQLLVHRRESAAVWKVVLGINNLDHPSAFTQTRFVKTIVLHPRYSRAVVDYDISIVELSEDINETSYVRPVCLPSPEQSLEPDTYCYITGWGHMGNKKGEVRIISLEQCQSYFDMKTITNRMICAGYESGTVDSCMVNCFLVTQEIRFNDNFSEPS
ncbi:Atrial natriuretic peptide-converting enzyme [Sciurus carolinensis]|uniref:Atrial natriuretic peptide-converting enzyme n=1 Tax=Sciurus carolinensis TaxID=30640 RepID=A0AA41SYU2_SCICA|nr:Atrial natriuretic peptide-converting enzyme [Sciurus carolinensis]